ncbi:MAG TPA: ATP-binding protein [Thermoanaerobaculia bacterium]|nr:ATP-binding protein [Thermoanaerobaculia bacterium]
MPEEAYLHQVLYMLIQDLAELWLEDSPGTRALHSLHEKQLERIARKIQDITGVKVTPKTLRNYIQRKIGEKSQYLDLIAAAWLVATKQLDEKAVSFADGTTDNRFSQCVALFRRRNNEIMKCLSRPEGQTLEFKEEMPGPNSLANTLSAFANSSGGMIVIGVNEHHLPLIDGLTGNEQALTRMNAALRRLDPEPMLEYGWFYVYDGDKKLFFIRIPAPPSNHKLVKSFGQAYCRRGSSDAPVETGPRIRGPKCKVTAARRKLLTALRRVLTIMGSSAAGEAHNVVATFSLIYIAEIFSTYLIDLMAEIHTRHTEDAGFVGDMNNVIEHRLEILRRGDIEAFLVGMKSTPTIFRALAEGREILERVFSLARIWRRNGGLTDEEYVASFGGALHTERALTVAEVRALAGGIHALSGKIDSATNSAYRLQELSMEDLPPSSWV